MNTLYKMLVALVAINAYPAHAQNPQFDKLGRLINYPKKVKLTCPKQTKSTGVLLVIGQSNTGNHAQQKMLSRYPGHIYNYFQGKCYEAASPLLGTTGRDGEFMTALANYLIEFGIYKDVVIISSGINGTGIEPWQKGGFANNMLMKVIEEAQQQYKLTEIVWHQGETDFLMNTHPDNYKQSFYSLISTLRKRDKVPFYYAIATRCSATWSPMNPIAKIQRTLANDQDKIYLAADTDTMVSTDERIDEYCHFKESGQLKTAFSFAAEISKIKQLSQAK